MRTTTRLAQWLRRSGPFDRDRMPSLGELAPRPLPVKASRRLFVVDLPEGDVPGFTIDVPGWTGHTADRKWTSTWLSEGYDGILFRGKGKDKTRIVPNGVESTVMFDRMPGVVRFENLTVVCGSRHGIWAGLEHPEEDVEPLFRLETFHVDVLSSGPRTTWGVFTIQCDVDLRSGTIDTTNGLEHTLYVHGVAQFGVYLLNMTFRSTAECVKIRSSTTETRAVPGAALGVQSCVFAFWYRDGSSRGGGGVVCQGTGLKGISVKGCFFRNLGPNGAIPSNQRTRAIMIDDGEGDYYSALDGTPREGPANGHVLIQFCGIETGPGSENLSIVIRCGNLGAGHKVARSFRVLDCGVWGQRLQLQLSDIPSGKTVVEGNNTPALAELSRLYGVDTSHEALIPLPDHVIPLSEGLFR